MANEAILLHEIGPPIPMTVSNTSGIEKGAILKMSDPNTAALADTDNDIVAGVAASEKIASDGRTKLGVYRNGIFKVYISGSVSVGDVLSVEGDTTNHLKAGGAVNVSGAYIWGIALETGTNGQTIMAELRPQAPSIGTI